MGHDELAKKLSLADVLHSANPLAVAADWADEYHLQPGTHDVTKVDPLLCSRIPTAIQMGKVYKRLILSTLKDGEDYADGILRVYNSPLCEKLDDYNCSAYYEPSPYITRSYYAGGFYWHLYSLITHSTSVSGRWTENNKKRNINYYDKTMNIDESELSIEYLFDIIE